MANENLHKDHRDRMRKDFLANGFSDQTPPHRLLELLLFYAIPRKDTNEIAHALLNRFKTIDAVFDASVEDLLQVEGIGENAASLIKLIVPLCRRYNLSKNSTLFKPANSDDMCDWIIPRYFGFTNEVFAVTSLDSRGAVIAFDILNEGDPTCVGFTVRGIIEKVLLRKAASVVLSHNHPKGSAMPSGEDIEMTKQIIRALAHIGVKVADHIIVCDDDCVSFAQTAELSSMFDTR